jgi:hypothetical protein
MDPPRHEKVFLGLIFKDQVVPKVCLFFLFFLYPASLQSWAVESALGITKGLFF